jgi:glycosyltransferase involved in cell wall biosynthesis
MPSRLLFYYGSQQFDTGSPKALAAQIALLDRSRFTPLFLASGEGPLVEELAARGVETVRAPVTRLSWRHPVAAWGAVRRQMALLRAQRVALLHVNEMGWNLDIVIAAWRLGIPVVLQLHLPGEVHAQNLHRFAATRVLLVSAAQREAIAHVERFRAPLDVLYSPVDIEAYGGGHDIRASLGLLPDDIVVCTIAQLREGKGIEPLLDAARRLAPEFPRLRFLVVGPLGKGEEEFGRRMMAQADSGPLKGVVSFTGSRKDIPDVLASSDIFLFPTRAETFGRAVAEAMAAGLPVVASRIPAIEEIVPTPDLGVLVSPRTGEAFADALRGVLLSADRGRAMGERGRASLTGRFDRDTIATKLNRIYGELTG